MTGTPKELIIDFELNPQPFGMPTGPLAVYWPDVRHAPARGIFARGVDLHGLLANDTCYNAFYGQVSLTGEGSSGERFATLLVKATAFRKVFFSYGLSCDKLLYPRTMFHNSLCNV
jgi:hypothetical protein